MNIFRYSASTPVTDFDLVFIICGLSFIQAVGVVVQFETVVVGNRPVRIDCRRYRQGSVLGFQCHDTRIRVGNDSFNRIARSINQSGRQFIAIGIAVPWVLKSQFSMFAYAALMGLGYGIYMAVDQALNVDVLPNPDEAGKDLGILNLANTLGQVIAPIVVSSIVVATGGYFLVFPIAIAAVMVGAVVILFIKKVK